MTFFAIFNIDSLIFYYKATTTLVIIPGTKKGYHAPFSIYHEFLSLFNILLFNHLLNDNLLG